MIRLTDGAHRLGRPISIRHPHAQRIAIRGNASMPELCRLPWDGPEDAIFAGAGIHLGEIDGVSIEHANPATRGAAMQRGMRAPMMRAWCELSHRRARPR